MKILPYLPFTCTLLLTACGGGGNDDGSDLIPPIVTPPPALSRCEQQSEFDNQTTASGLVFKLQSRYLAGQQSSVLATLARSTAVICSSSGNSCPGPVSIWT